MTTAPRRDPSARFAGFVDGDGDDYNGGGRDPWGNRDPYADLKQGTDARRQRLAQDMRGMGNQDGRNRRPVRSRYERDHGADWEDNFEERPAARLRNDYGDWDDVRGEHGISRDGREDRGQRSASRRGEWEESDISDKLVRRAMYGNGQEDNYRANPADFFSNKNDGYGVSRGESIFGVSIEDAIDSMAETSGMFDTVSPEQRRANQMEAHFGGIQKQALRQKQQVLARAHPMMLGRAGQTVNRIGEEYDLDRPMSRSASRSRFNDNHDLRQLKAEEERRSAMWEEQVAARAMPKANYLTREDRNDIWEMEARDKRRGVAVRYQDSYNLEFADSLMGRGRGSQRDPNRYEKRETGWFDN